MPKAKLSVTLDPDKVAQGRQLLGSPSVSHLLTVALDQLIEGELERRHLSGYLRRPPEADEDAWAEAERDPGQGADEVDWAHLYGVPQPR